MQRTTRSRAPRHSALAALLVVMAWSGTAAAQAASDAASAPANATDSLIIARAEAARVKGSASAPVTLVEVADFECPYCRRFFEQTYPKLDSAYIRTGKVKLAFVSLPLPGHRAAYPAAKAAFCAGAQGAFWPMHDRIYATQTEWADQPDATARFARLASALRLDMKAYADCTTNDRVAPLILSDAMQASAARINATPTFIINQKMLSGALSFEELKREIDAALAAAPPAPSGGTRRQR